MIRKIQPGASSNDVNFNPLIEEEPVTVKKRKRMNKQNMSKSMIIG